MSNIKPDDFRKHAAEEDFFRLAAMEIESEQNEEFLEAQSLPDPSPEVLARMQKNLQTTMRKTRKRKRHRTIFLQLGRLTACIAVVCGVLFSGAYFGVEAARDSINNFVLEMFDDHAVFKTNASEGKSSPLLPVDWNGPFNVAWVPAKFTNVHFLSFDYSWQLQFSNADNSESLLVCVWDAAASPNIDTEDLTLVEQINIHNYPASIYSKQDKNSYTLLWPQENHIVMIVGEVSVQEIEKIAANISFLV